MKKSPFFFAAFMVCLFILPEKGGEQMRAFAVGLVAPSWNFFHQKMAPPSLPSHQLELENKMLREQLEKLKMWSLSQASLQKELQKLSHLEELADESFFKRRENYLSQILSSHCQALPARVVFREPVNWSSCFWVSVGEKDNEALGKILVEKDSLVVVGKAIVGVIEEVKETRSRVRLITDGRLTPSVRAIRGEEQNQVLAQKLLDLIFVLSLREDLGRAKELVKILQVYQASLLLGQKDLYQAKGELRGGNRPLWRTPSQKLKGVGFHYYFEDEEGGPYPLHGDIDNASLIQQGDLLVTTGMDGIFPPDMHVAFVTKVFPLKEGECSYSIEAYPVVPDLHNLAEVFILPKKK